MHAFKSHDMLHYHYYLRCFERGLTRIGRPLFTSVLLPLILSLASDVLPMELGAQPLAVRVEANGINMVEG